MKTFKDFYKTNNVFQQIAGKQVSEFMVMPIDFYFISNVFFFLTYFKANTICTV